LPVLVARTLTVRPIRLRRIGARLPFVRSMLASPLSRIRFGILPPLASNAGSKEPATPRSPEMIRGWEPG
jgi:hypothetical protein